MPAGFRPFSTMSSMISPESWRMLSASKPTASAARSSQAIGASEVWGAVSYTSTLLATVCSWVLLFTENRPTATSPRMSSPSIIE
jgi:hypothetical protein